MAANSISIDLNVRDRGTAAVKKFAGVLENTLGKRLRGVTTNVRAASTSMGGFNKNVSGGILPLKTMAAAIAALGMARLVSDTVQTAQNMEALQLAFSAAAGGAKEGAAEFEFVQQQSERLGLELMTTARSYKGLLAATVASGKSSEDARIIFTGVAEAARAMGLSTEETKGTLIALQQIMSKGKVQAEELRQQLGERFPVAMGLMAESLGVSTAELNKLMEQGKVTSDALVPFAELLSKKYGKDLADAMKSSRAEVNRLQNTFTELKTAIGKGGLLDAVTIVAKGLRELFEQLKNSDAPQKIGEAFKALATQFVALAKQHGPAVVKAIAAIATVVANNVTPVFQTLKKTFDLVIGAIMAGFNQLTAIVRGVVAKAAQAFAFLAQQSAKVKALMLNEKDAMKLNRVAVEARNLAKKMEGLKEESIKTRDEWIDMLVEANMETKRTTTVTEDLAATVNQVGEAAQEAGESVKENTRKMTDGLNMVTGAIHKTADGFYSNIPSAAGASKTAVAEASETSKQKLDEVKDKGQEVADSLKNNFQNAGDAIGDSIEAGANRGEKALSGLAKKMKARSEEIDAQIKESRSEWEKFSVTIKMPKTLEGLKKYVADLRQNIIDLRGQQGAQFHSRGWAKAQIEILEEQMAQARDMLKRKQIERADLDRRFDETFNGGGGRSGGRRNTPQDDAFVMDSPSSGGGGGRRPHRSSSVDIPPGGGGGVLIEGASFNVNVNGLDPSALDARGLARALAPALQEEVRRGSLVLGTP